MWTLTRPDNKLCAGTTAHYINKFSIVDDEGLLTHVVRLIHFTIQLHDIITSMYNFTWKADLYNLYMVHANTRQAYSIPQQYNKNF